MTSTETEETSRIVSDIRSQPEDSQQAQEEAAVVNVVDDNPLHADTGTEFTDLTDADSSQSNSCPTMAEEEDSGRVLVDYEETTTCCLGSCSQQANRVAPVSPGGQNNGVEFITFKPGRRIRVICRYPESDGGNPAGNQSEAVNGSETLGKDDNDGDQDEEYWFENAAPNRLPVIQPAASINSHQQQSRIINKFEPRMPSSYLPATTNKLEEDLISPGRLPRKSFIKEDMIKSDDYEDEEIVRTSIGDDTTDSATASLERNKHRSGLTIGLGSSGSESSVNSDSLERVKRNSPVVMASRSKSGSAISQINITGSLTRTKPSSLTREGSSESSRSPSPTVLPSDEKSMNNLSSSIKAGKLLMRSKSPVSDSTKIYTSKTSLVPSNDTINAPTSMADSPSDSQSDDNVMSGAMLLPSKSPDPADDSCHPSPEIPHRTVCEVPDPKTSAMSSHSKDLPSVVVSNSTMGGFVNKGFNYEEDGNEQPMSNDGTSPEPNKNIQDLPDHEEHAQNAINNMVSENDGGKIQIRSFMDYLKANDSDNSDAREQVRLLQKPILFFLHGVGGSADIWSTQLNYFVAKGFQVVAPDMLGHGFSSCPDKVGAYTFTKLYKDIITIFDAYIPDDEQAVVICHSYGCSFGAALARTRPEKVASLIMIASGGPTPLAPPPNLSRYPKFFINCFKFLLECKYRSQQHKYNPRGKTIKFKEAFDVPSYVFKYIMLGQIWPEGDAGFHRRISAPTLLVYGMRDTLVSLVEECEMERTIPRAYLELIPTAGHCVMLDTPSELNVMMSKFIRKWCTDYTTTSVI